MYHSHHKKLTVLKKRFENDIFANDFDYQYEHYKILNLIKDFKNQTLNHVKVSQFIYENNYNSANDSL